KNLNDENRELNDVNPENTGFRKDRNEAHPTDIDTHNQSGTHGIESHDTIDVENLPRSTPGWKVVLGEVFADKIALFSLIIMIALSFCTAYGVISGYFVGQIDNLMMRIVDFMMVLPFIMIIVVYVTISPDYSIVSFSLIMSAFLWTGTARLIRSLAIQEKEQ